MNALHPYQRALAVLLVGAVLMPAAAARWVGATEASREFEVAAAGPGRASRTLHALTAGPGVPHPGLRYLTLPPDEVTTYDLLVIPVQFPEDLILGGGERDGLSQQLNGEALDELNGYYEAATRGRMRVRSVLAPTVIAGRERSYYTPAEDRNYPQRIQELVSEATLAVVASVDFRLPDNTGDGIADGLLILHSGPAAPEAGPVPPDVIPAHAFTLETQVPRGDGWIFPYAIASTSDPVGPWAHEMGHLLGLPDLYNGNPLAPGPGVGLWSLMGTGAQPPVGEIPAGLDATSLVKLGFEPLRIVGSGVDLTGGWFLRAFRAEDSAGPEYFLLERRMATDGLYVPDVATILYRVNETYSDNRSPVRLHVERLGVFCRGTNPCSVTLDGVSDPPLVDAAGEPTGLILQLLRDVAGANYAAPDLLLESVRKRMLDLGERLEIRFRNTSSRTLRVSVHAASSDPFAEVFATDAAVHVVAPGEFAVDGSWFVRSAAPDSAADAFPLALSLVPESGVTTTQELPLARTGRVGIRSLDRFTITSLAPGRENPWVWEDDSRWVGRDPAPLADGLLVSPWFTPGETPQALSLRHDWSLDALAPDAASDGGTLVIETATGALTILAPGSGWGYVAERSTGNPLAGHPVLSGTRDRADAFDLTPWVGETIRVRCRLGGDAVDTPGAWRVRYMATSPLPGDTQLHLEYVGGNPPRVRAYADPPLANPEQALIVIYAGPEPLSPDTPILIQAFADTAEAIDQVANPGDHRRYAALLGWQDPVTRERFLPLTAYTSARVSALASGSLLPPRPNPVPRGEPQIWSVEVPANADPAQYRFQLVDVAGRVVRELATTWAQRGRREVLWDGEDQLGRIPASGVYVLACTANGARVGSRKVVVVP